MKKAIYTFSMGYKPNESSALTLATIISYSRSCQADLQWFSNINQMSTKFPGIKKILEYAQNVNPEFYKLYAIIDFAFSDYDQMMFINHDTLVRNNAFNLFEMQRKDSFLASQYIGATGTKHLLGKKEESEVNLENISAEPVVLENLKNSLRHLINTDVYLMTQSVANVLAPQLTKNIESCADTYENYLIKQIVSTGSQIDEIPEKCHANPLRGQEDFEHFLKWGRHIDFFNFNQCDTKNKTEEIKDFFEQHSHYFCRPVIMTGKISQPSKS